MLPDRLKNESGRYRWQEAGAHDANRSTEDETARTCMKNTTKTPTTIDWYLSRFRTWEAGMNGASKTALHAVRKQAIDTFSAMGFPTTRDEEWRFTNVAPIAATAFAPSLAPNTHSVRSADVQKHLFAGVTSSHLVFINGHSAPEFSSVASLPPGVRVESLARALERDQESVLRHLARHAPGSIFRSGLTGHRGDLFG